MAVFDPAEVVGDVDVAAVVGEADAFEAGLRADFDRAAGSYGFDFFAGWADDVDRGGSVDLEVAAVGGDRGRDFRAKHIDVAACEFKFGGFDRRQFAFGRLLCLCRGGACDFSGCAFEDVGRFLGGVDVGRSKFEGEAHRLRHVIHVDHRPAWAAVARLDCDLAGVGAGGARAGAAGEARVAVFDPAEVVGDVDVAAVVGEADAFEAGLRADFDRAAGSYGFDFFAGWADDVDRGGSVDLEVAAVGGDRGRDFRAKHIDVAAFEFKFGGFDRRQFAFGRLLCLCRGGACDFSGCAFEDVGRFLGGVDVGRSKFEGEAHRLRHVIHVDHRPAWAAVARLDCDLAGVGAGGARAGAAGEARVAVFDPAEVVGDVDVAAVVGEADAFEAGLRADFDRAAGSYGFDFFAGWADDVDRGGSVDLEVAAVGGDRGRDFRAKHIDVAAFEFKFGGFDRRQFAFGRLLCLCRGGACDFSGCAFEDVGRFLGGVDVGRSKFEGEGWDRAHVIHVDHRPARAVVARLDCDLAGVGAGGARAGAAGEARVAVFDPAEVVGDVDVAAVVGEADAFEAGLRADFDRAAGSYGFDFFAGWADDVDRGGSVDLEVAAVGGDRGRDFRAKHIDVAAFEFKFGGFDRRQFAFGRLLCLCRGGACDFSGCAFEDVGRFLGGVDVGRSKFEGEAHRLRHVIHVDHRPAWAAVARLDCDLAGVGAGGARAGAAGEARVAVFDPAEVVGDVDVAAVVGEADAFEAGLRADFDRAAGSYGFDFFAGWADDVDRGGSVDLEVAAVGGDRGRDFRAKHIDVAAFEFKFGGFDRRQFAFGRLLCLCRGGACDFSGCAFEDVGRFLGGVDVGRSKFEGEGWDRAHVIHVDHRPARAVVARLDCDLAGVGAGGARAGAAGEARVAVFDPAEVVGDVDVAAVVGEADAFEAGLRADFDRAAGSYGFDFFAGWADDVDRGGSVDLEVAAVGGDRGRDFRAKHIDVAAFEFKFGGFDRRQFAFGRLLCLCRGGACDFSGCAFEDVGRFLGGVDVGRSKFEGEGWDRAHVIHVDHRPARAVVARLDCDLAGVGAGGARAGAAGEARVAVFDPAEVVGDVDVAAVVGEADAFEAGLRADFDRAAGSYGFDFFAGWADDVDRGGSVDLEVAAVGGDRGRDFRAKHIDVAAFEFKFGGFDRRQFAFGRLLCLCRGGACDFSGCAFEDVGRFLGGVDVGRSKFEGEGWDRAHVIHVDHRPARAVVARLDCDLAGVGAGGARAGAAGEARVAVFDPAEVVGDVDVAAVVGEADAFEAGLRADFDRAAGSYGFDFFAGWADDVDRGGSVDLEVAAVGGDRGRDFRAKHIDVAAFEFKFGGFDRRQFAFGRLLCLCRGGACDFSGCAFEDVGRFLGGVDVGRSKFEGEGWDRAHVIHVDHRPARAVVARLDCDLAGVGAGGARAGAAGEARVAVFDPAEVVGDVDVAAVVGEADAFEAGLRADFDRAAGSYGFDFFAGWADDVDRGGSVDLEVAAVGGDRGRDFRAKHIDVAAFEFKFGGFDRRQFAFGRLLCLCRGGACDFSGCAFEDVGRFLGGVDVGRSKFEGEGWDRARVIHVDHRPARAVVARLDCDLAGVGAGGARAGAAGEARVAVFDPAEVVGDVDVAAVVGEADAFEAGLRADFDRAAGSYGFDFFAGWADDVDRGGSVDLEVAAVGGDRGRDFRAKHIDVAAFEFKFGGFDRRQFAFGRLLCLCRGGACDFSGCAFEDVGRFLGGVDVGRSKFEGEGWDRAHVIHVDHRPARAVVARLDCDLAGVGAGGARAGAAGEARVAVFDPAE